MVSLSGKDLAPEQELWYQFRVEIRSALQPWRPGETIVECEDLDVGRQFRITVPKFNWSAKYVMPWHTIHNIVDTDLLARTLAEQFTDAFKRDRIEPGSNINLGEN